MKKLGGEEDGVEKKREKLVCVCFDLEFVGGNNEMCFWVGFIWRGREGAGHRVVSRVSSGISLIDPYQLFTSRFNFRFAYFINLGTFTNLTSIYL